MNERLDKIIAQRCLLSRTEAAAAIRSGRVCVNGTVLRDPAGKADAEKDALTLDGKSIRSRRYIYIMMNKPAGVLSATEDKNDPTVLDLLPDVYKKRQLGVVGRLDKDVTGLLLLTDDGELNHRLTSPKSRKPKLYRALLDDVPGEECRELFRRGLDLGDFVTAPAELQIEGKICLVTVSEGKFHQVKRMFARVGRTVLKLERLRIGGLSLDETLAPGEWRELSDAEIASIE